MVGALPLRVAIVVTIVPVVIAVFAMTIPGSDSGASRSPDAGTDNGALAPAHFGSYDATQGSAYCAPNGGIDSAVPCKETHRRQ